MPRTKRTQPTPTKQKGQRSLDVPPWIQRILPQWTYPKWCDAEMWRHVVAKQPFATICRETLISNIVALDWKVEPRDSEMRDELKGEIDYYARFFEHTGDYDYTHIIEWELKDFLDIPFGAGAELGYKNDDPNQQLLWIELLDGGTLFPTNSADYPVGQAIKELAERPVYFPEHAINRLYMSPRTEMKHKGWGMAPPEKIYLALELLNRGDYYYATLLLDTPEAGLLDLGDMSEASAKKWVHSFREMLTGIDPFKIPVLYEHQNPIQYINFGRPPTEMMFDKVTLRYASITCAAYGMSLSDIGIQAVASGGETLAGSIRQERQTRKSGLARTKRKVISFFNKMLPDSLMFNFIDLDDELSVALGRAMLSQATAVQQLIAARVFSPAEMRRQLIANGIISIPVPEELPDDSEFPDLQEGSPERPSMLGRPVAPSEGGHGEVVPRSDANNLAEMLDIE